jgi:GTP-binding protein Era
MDSGSPEIIISGMVALAGPPNAGKSTLMNRLLGQKISIVSPKPQTTRNRIAGVLNGEGYQIVFLDTPGLHQSSIPLNREMNQVALNSLNDVEAVVFMVDVSRLLNADKRSSYQEELRGLLQSISAPTFLLLNKIDLVKRSELLPMIGSFSALHPFAGVIPVSAVTGDGLGLLVDELLKVLPRGAAYFPEDVPTDASQRFLAAEIIREKVFLLTGQEIPYSSAVLIESFKEGGIPGAVEIHATIYLERKSQKPIIIGKGGSKIKQIGSAARKEIEEMLEQKVVLHLWVKIKKHWSRDDAFLQEMGF